MTKPKPPTEQEVAAARASMVHGGDERTIARGTAILQHYAANPETRAELIQKYCKARGRED